MTFRKWMWLRCLRTALWMAQRKPAPASGGIPQTGDKAESTDVLLVRLGTDEKSQRFTFSRLTIGGASGFWHLSANEKPLVCELKNEALLNTKHVLIGRFVKGYEFTYRSLPEFFLGELTLYPARYIRRDRAEQKRFDKKALVKRDRTNVLRAFVEKTLQAGEFHAGPSLLMSELYTSRWVRHPEHERLLNHYDFILQSLEQSGDLKRATFGYEITPKAVTTLAAYEEDDRRHRDNWLQQVFIGILTAALIIIAIVQAGISFWAELKGGGN